MSKRRANWDLLQFQAKDQLSSKDYEECEIKYLDTTTLGADLMIKVKHPEGINIKDNIQPKPWLIPVHREFIMSTVPYFESMFSEHFRENKRAHESIVFADAPVNTLGKTILKYLNSIYADKIEFNDDDVVDLLLLADYWSDEDFKQHAIYFIGENLNGKIVMSLFEAQLSRELNASLRPFLAVWTKLGDTSDVSYHSLWKCFQFDPVLFPIGFSDQWMSLSCRNTKAEIVKFTRNLVTPSWKNIFTPSIMGDIAQIEWEFKLHGNTNFKDCLSDFAVGYVTDDQAFEKLNPWNKWLLSGPNSGGFRLQAFSPDEETQKLNRQKFNLAYYDQGKQQVKPLAEKERITCDTTFNIKIDLAGTEQFILSKLSTENPGELVEIASIPTRHDAIDSSVRLVFAIATLRKGNGISLVNTKECMKRIKLHGE